MTIALPSTDKLMPYSEDFEINLNETEFADGYERVQAVGINTTRRVYSLTWIAMEPTEANTLRDALLATRCVETVTWTPEGEATLRSFRIKKNSIKCRYINSVEKQVSCTLREKFA